MRRKKLHKLQKLQHLVWLTLNASNKFSKLTFRHQVTKSALVERLIMDAPLLPPATEVRPEAEEETKTTQSEKRI